jgi:hypothetical protein
MVFFFFNPIITILSCESATNRRHIMYPQSAKQALEQLQSIPTIHQDYSSFRFSRLFHYDHLELEGFSISEGCWVTLWSIHNLA